MPAGYPVIACSAPAARVRRAVGRFLVCTRAGATSIAAAAVTVMTVAGAALIIDHTWLVGQRDVLQSAADAAAVAATIEMNRQLAADPDMSSDALSAAITPVARRYVELNLAYLPADRLARAKQTLQMSVTPYPNRGAVDVTAAADLGGTLLSRHLPLLGNYAGPATLGARADVETRVTPVEAVLAIDISTSMQGDLKDEFVAEVDESKMDIVKNAATALVDILRPSELNRVAVGVVPWHFNVRLADGPASKWSDNRWARYPTKRTYGVPYECVPSSTTCKPDAVDQQLPASAPEDWLGCLDGHRMGSTGTHAANPEATDLFTLPSVKAFSQAYFPAFHGAAYRCWGLSEMPSDFSKQHCYDAYDPKFLNTHPPQYGCESSDPTILPLSTDRAAIIGAIDGLSAIGEKTYSALGVLWAQRMLLSSWRSVWGGTVHPVDPTADDGKGVRKVIVLLTDGEDSLCGDGNIDCADSPVGISRTEACTQAKNAGTEIFVVAAMHPNKVSAEFRKSLTKCSSQSDDSDGTYVFLNNATPESLQFAFAGIANQLRVLRRTN